MRINQISVFLENKTGRLGEVCALLGRGGINIRALTIADSEDYGVLRMIVDNPEAAVALLKKDGCVVNQTEIVAVEVEDRPGGLAGVLAVLAAGGVNVEYMYGFLERSGTRALMVFRVEEPERAVTALRAEGIEPLGADDVVSM